MHVYHRIIYVIIRYVMVHFDFKMTIFRYFKYVFLKRFILAQILIAISCEDIIRRVILFSTIEKEGTNIKHLNCKEPKRRRTALVHQSV